MDDCCVPGEDTNASPENTAPPAQTTASAAAAASAKTPAKTAAKATTKAPAKSPAAKTTTRTAVAKSPRVTAPKRGGAALPDLAAPDTTSTLAKIDSTDADALKELAAWPKDAATPRTIDPLADPYFITVPEGTFLMGGADADGSRLDGEGPVRPVHVSAFALTATHVTNAQFAKFVADTGYVTECEDIGWSYLFGGLLKGEKRKEFMIGHSEETAWWLAARTVHWRTPQGPDSTWEDFADHPVVHVSLRDAQACAEYYGGRLVTEAEWEKAARGGITHARFPWGLEPVGVEGESAWRANIWQGKFPVKNTLDDGFLATSPVTQFAPNAMGFYDMAGNVWDWTNDWYSNSWHVEHTTETRVDPVGPETGKNRVIRGGSYLCHDSYCNRYRVAGRTSTPVDSSTGHVGFRIARDA